MKRILFILLLASAAWAQDQLPAPIQVSPPNASTACTMNRNVVSGNVLIASVFGGAGDSLSSVTDSRSTSFTLVDSNTSTGETVWVLIGVLASSGADTLTMHGSFGGAVCMFSEWPASIGSTVDAHTNGTFSGTPATVTTSSITTTVNGDLLFTLVGGSSGSGKLAPQSPTLSLGGISYGGAAGYRFSGTNGSYNAVFTNVTNSTGAYVIFALKPSAISIVTTSLPTAIANASYSYCLQAVGGAGAYTWSLNSGALPSGLSINSSTGCVTGTPTGATTTPTFKVTDGSVNATSAMAVTVNSSAATIAFLASAAQGSFSLGTITTGQLIMVACSGNNGYGMSAPTDTLSTPFKFLANVQRTSSQMNQLQIFTGVATSTGSDTITISTNPGGGNGVAVAFSNAQAFFDVIGNAQGQNSGSATLSGPALTTLAANSEIWAAVMGLSGNSTWTAGTGFTAETLGTSTGSPTLGEHGSQASIGTITPQFVQTANTDGTWLIQAVALRPAGNGTPFVPATGFPQVVENLIPDFEIARLF
jgi:hypothetical protein